MRFGTAGAVLLLLFFGVSIMIAKNPKLGLAAGIEVRHLDDLSTMYMINGGTNTIEVWTGNDKIKSTKYFLIKDNVICPLKNSYDDYNDEAVCDPNQDVNPTQPTKYKIPENFSVVLQPIDGITHAVVYMEGTNHFANLTINGTGLTVSHPALTVADIVATDTNQNSSIDDECVGNPGFAGCNKKIDLEIDGDLIVSGGGSIDVDRKGYPAGFLAKNTDPNTWIGSCPDWGTEGQVYSGGLLFVRAGFGLGGGGSSLTFGGAEAIGGGGSFIGHGSPKASSSSGSSGYSGSLPAMYYEGGGVYDNPTTAPVDLAWGSGGGGAVATHSTNPSSCTLAQHGQGGGKIHVIANNIKLEDAASTISANGENSVVVGTAYSGAGSGGSIWLEMYNGIEFPGAGESDASVKGFHEGLLTSNLNPNAVFNISAAGGKYDSIYKGGGGRIMINKIIRQKVAVKKVLGTVIRNGTGGDYNPYTLQKGDFVQVDLQFSNLVPGNLHVEEELLQVPYSTPAVFCDVTDMDRNLNNHHQATWYGGPGNGDIVEADTYDNTSEIKKMTFDKNIPIGILTIQLFYWCKVN